MEKVFIIGSLVHELLILELVSCIDRDEPRVLIAPAIIMRPMIVALKLLVTSTMI